MKLGILSLILLLVVPVAAAQTPVSQARAEQWREDLRYLTTDLPRRHPNLFFRARREDFNRAAADLDQAIPRLRDAEIRVALMRLVAMIGDNHTAVRWRAEDFASFPLRLYEFSDGLYVTQAAEEYRRAVGARLVRIGETEIAPARAAVSSLIPCENEACLKSSAPFYLVVPEFLAALGLLPGAEQGQLTFESREGERFTLTMRPVAPDANINWATAFDARRAPLPLYRRRAELNYWYEYLADQRLLYFNYSRCQEMPARPFGEFANELLSLIDTRSVERLVIDMRRNGGGSELLLLRFIEELRRRPAFSRQGRVFVIIGRATFSSAFQNALSLKRTVNAILVGEPAGQKPNHYGEVRTMRLPHSGIEIGYSTRFFRAVAGDPPLLVPDISAELSFAGYLAGRDPALEAVLAYQPR